MLPVYATNTVITNGIWIGSDAVQADPTANPPVVANPGTATRTNSLITVTNVRDQKDGVSNVNDPIEVVAYQIVKGTYKDGKLTNYVLCDATNAPLADMEAPTTAGNWCSKHELYCHCRSWFVRCTC